jgi:hypothetical protein
MMTKSSSLSKDGKAKAAPTKVKVSKISSAAGKAKKKISHPIPKSWPVSSRSSYPAPVLSAAVNKNNDDDDEEDDQFDILSTSSNEQQQQQTATTNTVLQPGNLLQQNCNGCDVFLRKNAVQSTSTLVPTKGNMNNKGAPKRFLIVFPGRMTLNAPNNNTVPAKVTTKDGDDNDEDVDDKDDTNNNDNNGAKQPTKRSPFAPANPPQLLGRIVSLGGSEQKVELRIPFPSNTNTANDDDNDGGGAGKNTNNKTTEQQQMVLTGRAIPLSGKYMTLSFKRTGGKDSAAAASTPKNKKMGTGSITCKDIFRSVIVLGESQMLDKDDKKVAINNVADTKTSISDDEKEAMKLCHYGGSGRTVDGGGKSGIKQIAGKRSFNAAVPAPLKQSHDEDESSAVDSLDNSDDSDDDDDDEDEMEIENDGGSDDEFIPTSAKKKRSTNITKKRKRSEDESDDDEDAPVARKRTPRRSAAKATNISYAEEDSDVEMSDDDVSGTSPKVTQEIGDYSDDSSIVEEVVPKKKRAAAPPASKKRKLSSSGTPRNKHVDESTYIIVDSDDDDKIKTPSQVGKANSSKAATGPPPKSNGVASKSRAKADSTSKSLSPRRRKKMSPTKPSPKKQSSLDLDDDPFAFL